MLLVREIMYCKPGKVRPLLEKFRAMAKIGEKKDWGKMRLLTDVCGERYWTLIAEMEVHSLDEFMKMMEDDSADMEEVGKIMEGYHDLVDYGRREVYNIEE